MELLDLKLFREIARHGSVTLAAHSLALSQPTASRRLQRLERELHTELVQRSAVPLEVTSAGGFVLDFADVVLRQYEALQQRLGQVEMVAGTLLLATSTTTAARLVTDWVADFVSAQPRVRVTVSEMASHAVERAVAQGEASIGFMGIAPHLRGITAVVVAHDEIVLLVPTHGEFRSLPDVLEPGDLADLAFVDRESGSGTADTVAQTLRAHGFSADFRTVMRVSTGIALLHAVEAGIGAGFVSRQFASSRPLRGARIAPIANLPIGRQLFMVYREHEADQAPVLKAFLRFARMRL